MNKADILPLVKIIDNVTIIFFLQGMEPLNTTPLKNHPVTHSSSIPASPTYKLRTPSGDSIPLKNKLMAIGRFALYTSMLCSMILWDVAALHHIGPNFIS